MDKAKWLMPLMVIVLMAFAAGVASAQSTPVADDQELTTDEDTPVAITLTGSDADDDPLTYSVVSGPSNGTLEGTPPDLTYIPDADYNGEDSFTFTVSDGNEESSEATVSITVNPVNDPPVANDQEVTTDQNVALAITLTGSDADDDPLTYSVVSGPSNGTLEGTPPDLTYTPDADYNGEDSFTFTVSDGNEESSEATVSIMVGDEGDIEEEGPGDEDGDWGTRKGFVGTVVEVDGNKVCVSKQGEDCEPIMVPSGLVGVKTPSRFKDEDLDGQWFLDWVSGQEGPIVVAVLAVNTDSGWEAVQILVKPDKAKAPKIGTTIAVDEESNQITILTSKGKKYTIGLPEDQGLPEEGDVVTVFEDPDEADEGEDGMLLKAKGLVKASQVRERLEKHLASLTQSSEELSEGDAQLANELAELLINHTGLHLGILKRMSEEGLPSSTAEIVSAALAKTNNASQQAQSMAARAKAKAASAGNRGKPEEPGSSGKPQGLDTANDEGDEGKPSNTGSGNQGKGSTGSGKGKG